jgi:lysozyme family protein
MNFDQAFAVLVDPQHEGGFTKDVADPGNWTGGQPGQGVLKGTKYGISAKSYPGEDIENLTLDRAKALYLRDFWGPAGCDLVPDPVKYQLFDTAVNTSAPGHPVTAIRMLQRAIGVTDDGVIGPQTTLRLSTCDGQWLLRRFQAQVLRYYTSLSDYWFQRFGKGVVNRVATNMEMTT